MIAVYPMLVSPNVNPTILPGICKVLERFIIIYELEELAEKFDLKGKMVIGGAAGKAGQASKFLLKHAQNEGIVIGEVKGPQAARDAEIRQQWMDAAQATINARDAETQGARDYAEAERARKGSEEAKKTFSHVQTIAAAEKSASEKEKHEIDVRTSKQTMKVNFPGVESMHLEPTFVTVDTNNGTKLLGIKVIPYPIKNNEELVRMISSDLSLNSVDEYMYSHTRNLFKHYYNLHDFLAKKLPFMSQKNISGNLEKDIIFSATKYKQNVFCLLSQQDLENDSLFKKAGSVSKLFGLGWSSIIINDDVNKRTNFCMKQFGGMCSTVPHGFLFSSFGKENFKVYENMEDIQKVTSPFFKHKVSPKRLFEEWIIELKIDRYLNYLSEDIKNDIENVKDRVKDESGNIKEKAQRRLFGKTKEEAIDDTFAYANKKSEAAIEKVGKVADSAKKMYGAIPKKVKVGAAVGIGSLSALMAAEIYRKYMREAARYCAGKNGKNKEDCMKQYKAKAKAAKEKILAKIKK